MTAGNEKSAKQLVWEPPRLMRLTAPGDARALCSASGSGDSDCQNGHDAPYNCEVGNINGA